MNWANYFKSPWQVPRIGTEKLYFGSEVSDLIRNKNNILLEKRPPRVGPSLPIPYPGEMIIQFWNSNELTRNFTTGGYVTIKGEPNFNKYVDYALDQQYSEVTKFLSEESKLIFIEKNQLDIDKCIAAQNCKPSSVNYEFQSYSPGKITISLNTLIQDQRVILNEIGWKGWQVKSCTKDGKCSYEKVGSQSENLLLNSTVSSGATEIIFEYKTPYLLFSWLLFYSAIIILSTYLIFQFSTNKINK